MPKGWSFKRTSLEKQLGLRFKDPALLAQALVHPSYVNESRPARSSLESYERLEFLGDSELNLIVTAELYKRRPDLLEGELTKLRSLLVRGTSLAKVAQKMDLGRSLKLGKGEESTGGRERESNLAAAFEAVVGALFLDGGHDAAKRFVLAAIGDEVESLLAEGAVPEDPKSRLQELVQRQGMSSPRYRLVDVQGPDHEKLFNVEVMVDGEVVGNGHGKRKSDAEKMAAENGFQHFRSLPT